VSIGIVSLLVLVIVVIIAVPILIRVVGEATRRDPNEEEDETSEREPNHDS
jgi:cytoskeletal protein RodZ